MRCVLALVLFGAVVGCSSEPQPTGPKVTLTEQEKKQVQDLNKQRQDEWSSTTKAKQKK